MPAYPTQIEQWRADTPGCRNVLHFNNAGASLMPQPVLDAVTGHLQREAEIGGYEAARQQEENLSGVYRSIAKLLGAQLDEIALMQNASRAWQQAFYAIPFQPGDRILTSIAEYASNYIAFLQVCRKTGATVEPVPNDESGQLDVRVLEAMLDEKVKLIAVTHIPTNGGLVNPAEAIGKLARRHGILYLLDACQSAGQLPLDVDAIGCDMLSATSRKYLRGPRGAGFLYVRREVLDRLEPPMPDLHGATWITSTRYELHPGAARFESWESSVAVNLGMGAAVDYALSIGLETIWERIQYLATLLRQQLSGLPEVTVQDIGALQCGLVSFTIRNRDPQDICRRLADQKINVSYSPPQSTLLDMRARGLEQGIVRASVHYYNTEEEIERFCETLKTL